MTPLDVTPTTATADGMTGDEKTDLATVSDV